MLGFPLPLKSLDVYSEILIFNSGSKFSGDWYQKRGRKQVRVEAATISLSRHRRENGVYGNDPLG